MKKYIFGFIFLFSVTARANNYCPCDGVCWTDDGCKTSDTPYACMVSVSDAAEAYCNQMDSGWCDSGGMCVAE